MIGLGEGVEHDRRPRLLHRLNINLFPNSVQFEVPDQLGGLLGVALEVELIPCISSSKNDGVKNNSSGVVEEHGVHAATRDAWRGGGSERRDCLIFVGENCAVGRDVPYVVRNETLLGCIPVSL